MLRKLARVTLNVLTALSLLLCVAACVLWVRSYWFEDHVFYDMARDEPSEVRTSLGFRSRQGRFSLTVYWRTWASAGGDSPNGGLRSTRLGGGERGWDRDYEDDPVTRKFLGFILRDDYRAGAYSFDRHYHYRSLVIPFWAAFVAAALLPSMRLAAKGRNRRRQRLGLCPACGYDLRGNTTGTCPECGAAVAKGVTR